MKMRSGLAIAGTAFAFMMMGHTAEARTASCPPKHEGGHDQQIEVPDDSLDCWSPPAPLSTTVQGAYNAIYTVTTQVDGGFDILQPGEVVEVEIDVEDVIASLNDNPKETLALAVALGVRAKDEPKPGIVRAVHTLSTDKLTEGELKQVATLLTASLKSGGKARGRSDPAGSWTSRVEATAQAISRAIQSFTSSLPSFGYSYTRIEYYPNGQKKVEVRQEMGVMRN